MCKVSLEMKIRAIMFPGKFTYPRGQGLINHLEWAIGRAPEWMQAPTDDAE
jgi:hypothetical protein